MNQTSFSSIWSAKNMAPLQEIFGSVFDYFNFQYEILIKKPFSIKFDPTYEPTFEDKALACSILLIMTVLMTARNSFFHIDGLKEQKEKPKVFILGSNEKKPGQLTIFFKLALYFPYIYLVFILYQIGLYIVYKVYKSVSQEYMLPLVDIPSICFAVIILNRLVTRIIDRKWIKKLQNELLITQYKQKDSKSETVSGYDPIFQFISIIISSSIGFWYFYGKHWIPSNVLTVAVAYGIIEFYSINQPGQLLGLMFTSLSFVDAYFMFFTDTYTKFARTYNASTEQIVTQDLFKDGFNEKWFAILGVQHILIPGLLIPYLMDNDHSDDQSDNDESLKKRNYVYLDTRYAAHFIGLGLSPYIMIVLNNSRPTFLFILPAFVILAIMAPLNDFFRMNSNLRNLEKELFEIEYTRFPFFSRDPTPLRMINFGYYTGLLMIIVFKQVCFSYTSLEICKNQVP